MRKNHDQNASGSNQYESMKGQPIVPAVYVENVLYKDNPLIAALPADLMNPVSLNKFLIVDKSDKTSQNLPAAVKKKKLELIRKFRFPLTFYPEVHEKLVSILYESYSSTAPNPYKTSQAIIENDFSEVVSSDLPEIGWTAPGFTLLGHSGSGKSICIQAVLSQLPPVIMHSLPDGSQIPQVTFLYAPCLHTGGIKAVCIKLAEDLDDKLQNGNVYAAAVSRKRTIEQQTLYMAQLLRLFNVGVVVLDEIQNLLSESSMKTLNTLTYLFNCSHTGIVLVGTEEAYEALTGKEYVQRRLGESIKADKYCEDYKIVDRILDALFTWYMFAETRTDPQNWDEYEQIKKFIFKFTGGIIYRITGIFHTLQKMLLDEEEKGKHRIHDQLTLKEIQIAAQEHARKNQWDKIPELNRIMVMALEEYSSEMKPKKAVQEVKPEQEPVQEEDLSGEIESLLYQKYSTEYPKNQIARAIQKVKERGDLYSLQIKDIFELMKQSLSQIAQNTQSSAEKKLDPSLKPSSDEMMNYLIGTP